MASITNDLSTIDGGTSLTNWRIDPSTPQTPSSLQLESGAGVDASTAIGMRCTSGGFNVIEKYNQSYNWSNSGTLIMFWLAIEKVTMLSGYTQQRFRIEDSGGNWSEWAMDSVGLRFSTFQHNIRCIIDVNSYTPTATSGSLNLANVTTFQHRVNSSGAPRTSIDSIQSATGVNADTTGLTTKVSAYDFQDIIDDDTTDRGWLVQRSTDSGVVIYNCEIEISGSGWFYDASTVVVLRLDGRCLLGDGVGHINITSTGTVEFGDLSGGAGINGVIFTRGATTATWDFTATASGTVNLYGCTFDGAGTFTLTPTDSTVVGCTFLNVMDALNLSSSVDISSTVFSGCAQIDPSAATMDSCQVIASIATTAMIFDSPSDCANISNISFTACNRCIEITSDTDVDYYFDNFTFTGTTGYDVRHSGDGDITIYVQNGGDSPTYENTGTGSVTVINAVTVSVYTKDTSGDNIENVRVFVEAASGGALPYRDSVSITRSSSTATVSHTGHGLSTGNYVVIRGAAQDEYNGDYQITVTGINSYTYTVSGTPATPATGTITSTARIINELTTASGLATEVFNYGSSQPIQGYARKSSSSPYYMESSITGTIAATGFEATLIMVSDE